MTDSTITDVTTSLRKAELSTNLSKHELELESIRLGLRRLHERSNFLNYTISGIKKEQQIMRANDEIL